MNTFIKDMQEKALTKLVFIESTVGKKVCCLGAHEIQSIVSHLIHATAKEMERRVEGKRKSHGYDLPTNDFCYSEHDVNNSFDQALTDVQSIIHEITDTKV